MPTIFKNGIISGLGTRGKSVIEGAVAGANDIGLNKTGTEQLDALGKSLAGTAADIISPIAPGVADVLRKQAGLSNATGGANAVAPTTQNLGFNKSGGTTGKDWRVKIGLSEKANYFYNDPANRGIMAPLFANPEGYRGIIFPYNPSVSLTHTARYGNQKLTHSNYDAFFYEGSEVSSIQIDGEFSCQTQSEAKYLLAAVYFLRACTKMWFGRSQRAGTPPPMVFLNGFGEHYFPNVPCVVTTFAHTMPNDVDYIATSNQPGGTRMPTNSQLNVTLQPVYSRQRLHNKFNLDDFAAGKLVDSGFI